MIPHNIQIRISYKNILFAYNGKAFMSYIQSAAMKIYRQYRLPEGVVTRIYYILMQTNLPTNNILRQFKRHF